MDTTLAESPVSDPPSLQSTVFSTTESITKIRLDTQWFGVDIGGSLVKCVYFDCPRANGVNEEESEGIAAMREFLKSTLKYGSSGIRDEHLEFSHELGGQKGTLHFIKFDTNRMIGFMNMVTENGLGKFSKVVCATGGGAFKFEDDFHQKLGIELHKYDEMESLIHGVRYFSQNCPGDCYYWTNPMKPEIASKVIFPFDPDSNPYIIVNIGSGVSVLHVLSPHEFKRIGGTSVGGGTFLGLCSLLTGTENFQDAITLAEKGDNTNVDKMVRDIYGGDYTRFGLSGDVVASSFGHMMIKEKRDNASAADLAHATLVTVSNNIGAIARMCASIVGVDRVVFVGNYLCNNELSTRMLAYAMEYWSQGSIKALFLKHEGYFGALGSMLLKLDEISEEKQNEDKYSDSE